MQEINSFLNIPGSVLLSLAIMTILKAVKASPIKDWVIPYLAFLVGAVGNCALVGFTVQNILIGILIGASAVGFHQGFKQASERDTDEPPPKDKVGPLPGIPLTAIIVLAIALWSGCANTGLRDPDGQANVRRTAAIVQTASQLGTYFAAKKEPECRPYFQAAIAVLNVLLNDHVYGPEEVRSALGKITNRENEDAAIAIGAAINLYAQYFGDQVRLKLDQQVYIAPVLIALRDGIALGMSAQATESAYRLTGR